MKACWTEKDAEYHGAFVDFDPVWVEPKPVSQPHPPIYIGATSSWAMDRIAEYGDGWLPVPVPELDDRLALLKERCAERGRDIAEIDVSLITMIGNQGDLAELKEKGINRVILSLPTVAEDEARSVLDEYVRIVEWARGLS
jgi:hypothetical protein